MIQSRKLINRLDWYYELDRDFVEKVYLCNCAICGELKVLKREIIDFSEREYGSHSYRYNREILFGKRTYGGLDICEKCGSVEGLHIMTFKLHQEINQLKKEMESIINDLIHISGLASELYKKLTVKEYKSEPLIPFMVKSNDKQVSG